MRAVNAASPFAEDGIKTIEEGLAQLACGEAISHDQVFGELYARIEGTASAERGS